MSKDAGLRIRVERELREKFLTTCHAQDRPAAQVLRDLMRDYIRIHEVANDPPVNHRIRKGASKS